MISVPKGLFRLAALKMFTQSSLSGSDLQKEMRKYSGGVWSPGPGSIYFLLGELRKEELVAELPREEFKREVEHHLTGRETEPWELLCFKVYKSQLPVVEKALETAALMLGTDKSRGYCLEMICADFLAGAALEQPDPASLLLSLERLLKLLPVEQKQQLAERICAS